MRKSLVLATLFVLICSAAAIAGVPDPTRSGCAVSSPPLGCQFRFRFDGGLDTMTLCVTLRDAFDTPVAGCTTTAQVDLGSANPSLCDCSGVLTDVSDPGGVIYFTWACIGGNGTADLVVTARCSGDIGICTETFSFTSGDMDADCDAVGSGIFDISDIGVFSTNSGVPLSVSDFDCNSISGLADIGDIGLFSGGVTFGCNDCP